MLQSLDALGLSASARALEAESGVSVQSKQGDALCAAVLDGRWSEAETSATALLAHAAESVRVRVRFCLLEQHYAELLRRGALADALALLQTRLAPCTVADESLVPRLHALSAMVLVADHPAAVDEAAERRAVLDRVRGEVPASALMPARRLDVLLAQAVQWQLEHCELHNDAAVDVAAASLLVDHRCGEHQLPSVSALALERHRDEVWHVAFAPDGATLASASKDGTVILWSVAVDAASGVASLRYQHTLRAHRDAVAFVQWSADGSRLLTFANNSEIFVFDAATAQVCGSFRGAASDAANDSNAATPPALAAIGACCWLDARCERIAVAGCSQDILVVRVADGHVLHSLRCARVIDMAVSIEHDRLVAITQTRQIAVYSISQLEATPRVLHEDAAMTSLQLSPDGRCALVCVAQAVHEWDLEQQRLVRAYRGLRQSRFVIRTSVGGARDAFVASGSEDACVYLWRRSSGALLARLAGHNGVVNAVAWNARHVGMIASASDDHTVRIWMPRAGDAQLVRVRRSRKAVTK